MALDLAGILGQVSETQKVAGNAASTINAASANIAKLQNANAGLEVDAGNLSALIEGVGLQGKLAVEQANVRTAASVGEDLNNSMGLQSRDAQELLNAQEARRTALAKVNAKNSTSLFTDPIGWLVNQFTINDDIEAHNAANGQIQDIEARVAERSKFLDSRYQNDIRQQSSVTAASIDAAAKKTLNVAQIAANKASMDAYATQSKAVGELATMSATQLSAAMQGFNAVKAQEQIGIAHAHLALAQTAETRAQEETQIRKDAKDADKAVGDYQQENIIAGLKAMYPNNPEKWEVPNSIKLKGIISGKIPLDGELKNAYEVGAGNRRIDPTGGTRVLAATPSKFAEVLQYQPYMPPDTKSTVALYNEATKDVNKYPPYIEAVNAKDSKRAAVAFDEFVRDEFAQAAKKVNSPDNPYALPTIGQIAQNIPGVQGMALYKTVLAPLLAAKADLSDPPKVFAAAVTAVQAGQISLNTAMTELATIYKAAQISNVKSKQIESIGVAPSFTYNAPIYSGRFSSEYTDQTDPAKLIRAASRELADRAAATAVTIQ